ncbi:MAG: IS21 family transposase [Firmicutes bacterium]|nr:IS21 family transposase [Bacillota bacterium]
MRELYERHAKGQSIRSIADELGIARNTVRRYIRAEGVPTRAPRPKRPSKLEPFYPYLERRFSEGCTNSVVLLRELREQGYTGGRSILKDYLKRHRPPKAPIVTRRFETLPGEQAQVDFGYFRYKLPDGRTRSLWAFVMVLSWSRAIYVEFIQRADLATFIRCHLHAFEHFGGVPQSGLYDNAKVVTLGRDDAGQPIITPEFLDFARRVGMTVKLCRPYRAQTKGRVESGVKYVRGNFWPSVRFTDLGDLNRQARTWCVKVADQRIHGTTLEKPADRLAQERPYLNPVPPLSRVADLLRDKRQVGRDGFVVVDRAWYGVPVRYAGTTVSVEIAADTVKLWSGDEMVAVHPRATRPGERLRVPGQWSGLDSVAARPQAEALAEQVADVTVSRRSLRIYEEVAGL